ncbi:MAG: protein arginine kinase [Planctomycetes bacterium]|nr:protein arginine kinase [Planctomycetota bacterium]MCC7398630.1 protein arginine kinase [Planctomycetota bacterium]
MKKRRGDDTPEFRPGTWLSGTGPDHDIAICTRVRLARNLQGFPFAPCIEEAQAKQVRDLVLAGLGKKGLPETLQVADLAGMDELERSVLVERHLISRDLAASKRAVALAFDSEESVALMINEEDHLRLQVFAPGLQPEAAWRRAERLDDALIQRLPIAWSEEFGFLTSCPTNTGTGLRLSVMVHLPGLVWSEEIDKATNTAQKIHLAVRGLYGEGSRALGDFYQVSNQVTLGRDEQQIQQDVMLAVSRLVHWERDVRSALLRGSARTKTLDRVHRALGTVERAQILSSEEALGCLSALRLGIETELLDGFDIAAINRALLLSQPGHLQRHTRQLLKPEERDQRRAQLLREVLGCTP